jgi:hypothetical protein
MSLSARAVVRVLAVWAAVRCVQVLVVRFGWGRDPAIYLEYARRWMEGDTPYADYVVAYPPGALFVFLAALFPSGGEPWRYHLWFELEMMAFDALALLVVLVWAGRRWPGDGLRRALALASYLAFGGVLANVLYARFDLVPAALAAAALLCALELAYVRAGGFLLGLAVAAKLWPVVLAPLIVAIAYRRAGVRSVPATGVAILAGIALPVVPLLWQAGPASFAWLDYMRDRSIQLESTWAATALLLDRLGLAATVNTHDHGTVHLAGRLPAVMAALTTPVSIALVALPLVRVWAALPTGAFDDRARSLVLRAATAMIVGTLVGAKILSPQFLIWALPLVAVVAADFPLSLAAALPAYALTAIVYPLAYDILARRGRAFDLALAVLVARDAALIALYAMLVLRWPATATAGTKARSRKGAAP